MIWVFCTLSTPREITATILIDTPIRIFNKNTFQYFLLKLFWYVCYRRFSRYFSAMTVSRHMYQCVGMCWYQSFIAIWYLYEFFSQVSVAVLSFKFKIASLQFPHFPFKSHNFPFQILRKWSKNKNSKTLIELLKNIICF